MNDLSSIGFIFGAGFGGGCVITAVVFFLYERENKRLQKFVEFLQQQLNSCLAKMMAVDYEKLAEADIRARATGQMAWLEAQAWVPELSDVDVVDPNDFRQGMKKNAK